MPGISTTGIYQQVRRMTIPLANWTGAAVSGNLAYPALNTTHGLSDGRLSPTAPNIYPSWIAEQMDAFRAYVVFASGNAYGDVESYISFPSYSAAGTDRVQVLVSTNLTDECYARFPNDFPLYLDIRVLFKSPHSIEGRAADLGEGFPAVPLGSLLAVPRGGGATSTMETVYVDPILGLDTNTGHTAGAGGAWQTMGRVKTYMEFVGTFNHSLTVVMAPGPIASWTEARSNFAPEGVCFQGEARLHLCGNAPLRDATNVNADKRLTIGGAGCTITSPRDCDHARLLPANGEIWQNNAAAPANVALVAADIGKTVRFSDANGHVGYATVSGVSGQGAAVANRWIEFNTNHPLFTGGIPAWTYAAATVWEILDPADATGLQVTRMDGAWNLMGIHGSSGSILQTDPLPSKTHSISHVNFVKGKLTFEDCDRFALCGVRADAGVKWTSCRDCSAVANAVSDHLADRYLPDSVWALQGFAGAGTNVAFGGMGFYTDITTAAGTASTSATQVTDSAGQITGLVATGPVAPNNGAVFVRAGTVVFTWASVGPDGADLARMWVQDVGSELSVNNCRLTCQLRADMSGTIHVNSNNAWLARAINAVDDKPDPGTAITKLNVGAAAPYPGMIEAENGGAIEIRQSAASTIEGINTDSDGGYVVHVGEAGKFVATGGHDADWYGDHGWLHLSGSSIGYMSGARTFAIKNNAILAADVYVYNATLTSGSTDIWTKNHVADTGDNFVSPVIFLDYHARMKLGTPAPAGASTLANNGGLIAGAAANGQGIRCGALGIVHINHGSEMTCAHFKVNNENACPAIVLANRSFLHFTGDDTAGTGDYIVIDGAAASAITDGSIAVGSPVAGGGFLVAGEAAVRGVHSDYLAAVAVAQGTFINHA
jgi:hypothetical protein